MNPFVEHTKKNERVYISAYKTCEQQKYNRYEIDHKMNEIYLEFKWLNVRTLKAQEKTEVDSKTSGKHKQVKWIAKED